jgi:hypothetical protein
MKKWILSLFLASMSLSAQVNISGTSIAIGGANVSAGVTSINGVRGTFTFTGGVTCTSTTCNFTGAGLTSLNGLTGPALTLVGDSSLTVTPSGTNINLHATGTGGSGVQYNPTTTQYLWAGTSIFQDDSVTVSPTSPVLSSQAIPVTGGSCGSNVCSVTNSGANNLSSGDWVRFTQVTGWPGCSGYGGTGCDYFQVSATGLSSTGFQVSYPSVAAASLTGGYAYNANNYVPFASSLQPFLNGHGTSSMRYSNTLTPPSTVNLDASFSTIWGGFSSGTTGNPVFFFMLSQGNDYALCESSATIEAAFQSVWTKAHNKNWSVVQALNPAGTLSQGAFGCSNAYQIEQTVETWLLAQGPTQSNIAAGGAYWDRPWDLRGVIADGGDTNLVPTSYALTQAAVQLIAQKSNEAMSSQAGIADTQQFFRWGTYPGNNSPGIIYTPKQDAYGVFTITNANESVNAFNINTYLGQNSMGYGLDVNIGYVSPNNITLRTNNTDSGWSHSYQEFSVERPNSAANIGIDISFNNIRTRIMRDTANYDGIDLDMNVNTAGGSGTTNFYLAHLFGDSLDAYHLTSSGKMCVGVNTATTYGGQVACPTSAQFSVGTTGQFQVDSSGNTTVHNLTCTGTGCGVGTATNCSSSASPAVCAAAAAGSVALPTNAVSSSIVVNTTAVTANSQIFVTTDDTLGTKLGVTCNSTAATLVGGLTISARTAGTSFTIANNVAIVTNPLCVSYLIVN